MMFADLHINHIKYDYSLNWILSDGANEMNASHPSQTEFKSPLFQQDCSVLTVLRSASVLIQKCFWVGDL